LFEPWTLSLALNIPESMESDQIKKLRSYILGHPFSRILLEITQEERAETYLVGGLVRDRLLGRETRDWDLALSQKALRTARIFAERAGGTFVLLREEGETARVVIDGRCYDFCNFRGPDLEADLRGRDFTINAMGLSLPLAFKPDEWIPYDPLDGIKDLQMRILRMAGPDCFRQDPLRLLRAFRLSAQLGLTLDPDTGQAIKRWAPQIIQSAAERIHYEWSLLLSQPDSFDSLNQMDEAGLLQILFPAMGRLKGMEQDRYHHLDVFKHSLLTLRCLEKLMDKNISLPADLEAEMASYLAQEKKRTWLKEAALFHDLGKGTTVGEKGGYKTFYGHAQASKEQFVLIAQRYRFSTREKAFLEKMIGLHMRPFLLVQEEQRGPLTRRAMIRFVREGADDLSGQFLLALADSQAAQGREKPKTLEDLLKKLWREALSARENWLRPLEKISPLISGRDLISLGLNPGPLFNTLLSKVEESRLAGEISTREEALNWVRKEAGLG
jgi:poly(A) polymerase